MLRMSINSMKSLQAIFTSSYVNCQRLLANYSMSGASQPIVGTYNTSQRFYSSEEGNIKIPIVSYEYVKDIPNQPTKMLVDVREPSELAESGAIPSSINIPCIHNRSIFTVRPICVEIDRIHVV